MTIRILLVAKNQELRTRLARILEAGGYAVHSASSVNLAREYAKEYDISLAMIAPAGLGPAGATLADELQARLGRLVVLADPQEQIGELADRFPRARLLPAHDLAPDDVRALVQEVLQASAEMPGHKDPEPEIFNLGPIIFNTGRRCVIKGNNVEIALTKLEFTLLDAFVRSPERVLSRDHLATSVYGQNQDDAPDRGIDNLVSRLRKKIEADPRQPLLIMSTINGGYRLAQRPMSPAPDKSGGNLPRPLTALIGRAGELARLTAAIARHRLICLAGPGGVGKTSLAIELGWQVNARFPGGIWHVDLAPLTDPDLVATTVSAALRAPLRAGGNPVDAVVAAIGKGRLLLILDNCEYQIGAVAELTATLLAQVPGLSVIVTSQEILGMPAEHIYRLEPLALPPPGAVAVEMFGAIALFVERARAKDERFRLDAANADSVVEICHRLDGIPLAIEMAASQLHAFGLEGLRARLGERLQMLGIGSQAMASRHSTLRRMVEWSTGLLDGREGQVFRRLAIFPGDFSLEAAVAAAGLEDDSPWEIVRTLERLIDRSLLKVEPVEPRRYRLLETLRLHIGGLLAATGEGEMVAERHARYFMALFDRAYEEWEVSPDAEWLAIYRPEIDNVRAALAWAMRDPSRSEIAISLAGSSALFWERLSLFSEGRRYVDHAVKIVDDDTPPAVAARVLRQFGILWHASDRLRGLSALKRAVELYRGIGDRLGVGSALATIGVVYNHLGRHREAEAALFEARDSLAGSERHKSLYNVMNNLGARSVATQDAIQAKAFFSSALDAAEALQDVVREMQVLANLAEVEFGLGAVANAVELGEQALSRLRSVERSPQLGWLLLNLASYLIVQGDVARARTYAAESLALVCEDGGQALRVSLQLWALLSCLEDRPREAARLIGFVDAGYTAAGDIREPTEQMIHRRVMNHLALVLSQGDILQLTREGALLSEKRAINLVATRIGLK